MSARRACAKLHGHGAYLRSSVMTRSTEGSVMTPGLVYLAFIPVVFLTCSTNLLVNVFETSTLALATSGDPSLNTASTASAPFGSILPVSEYIGIVFFSASR